MLGCQLESDLSLEYHPTPTPIQCSMSRKKQKLSSKISKASEELTHEYDHEKFFNESATEKFSLISKNRSFIKEKEFHHLMISFVKPLRTRDGGHCANLQDQLP